ncbi:ParA family protein [Caldimonas brevitalea]|uniref:Cobyrinic acid a,c-diamide synthase n=1 Tax=Caldimonas brevitalea TaxID=413882 RepID=A0A0G3BF99_9BURK|nr:ParA family protein [Caldimonas brevitalea]AKJ27992.1 cobyrinic acid a,c-diamide synthase [Caldimonas brevitalea]
MPVIVVANPKGGVGKSTLATHVAAYFAHQGHQVMLGDVDRQQSSRTWLSLRPSQAVPILGWEVRQQTRLTPPKGTTHAVLDTPAGLHGKRLDHVMQLADRILVPLQPSIFDIYATRAFLDEVLAHRKSSRVPVGLVGMRVREGTIAADQLKAFVATLEVPVVAYLRDTQHYIQLAAHGLTLWDVAPSRVEKDLAQWRPIVDWLQGAPAPSPASST